MKLINIKKFTALAAVCGLAGASAFGSIDTFTTSGTGSDNNQPLAASAIFNDNGSGNLKVTLKNTYSGSTFGIAETLFGLFFDSGSASLTLQSVYEPVGDVVWTVTGGNTYTKTDVNSDTAITQWKTATLGGEKGVDGLQGGPADGLVSTGFGPTFNDGIKSGSHNPDVESSLVFNFTYTGSLDVTNVNFLWGTTAATSDTTIGKETPVPEASTIVAGALLLLPFGASTLRILRRNRAA